MVTVAFAQRPPAASRVVARRAIRDAKEEEFVFMLPILERLIGRVVVASAGDGISRHRALLVPERVEKLAGFLFAHLAGHPLFRGMAGLVEFSAVLGE
jgi:hypothetical protein